MAIKVKNKTDLAFLQHTKIIFSGLLFLWTLHVDACFRRHLQSSLRVSVHRPRKNHFRSWQASEKASKSESSQPRSLRGLKSKIILKIKTNFNHNNELIKSLEFGIYECLNSDVQKYFILS